MVQRVIRFGNLIYVSRFGSSFSKLGAHLFSTSQAASSLQQICEPATYRGDEEYANLNWDELGFGLVPTDYMYIMKCSVNEEFSHGELCRYGNIELSPSSGILNYGQVPPPGKGSLYLRPLLIGSGPVLGLAPAPDYTFIIYASPVGNYFKEGLAPVNLFVEEEFHRATPGGTGGVKTITNYAPVLKAQTLAKTKGFSDVLYLDSVKKKNLEEVSSCNIFIVKGESISTPAANGTVLAGVTRKSIIDIARDYGYQVEERPIPVEELIDADEVFCTGTAVVVAPVGSITYQGKRTEYKTGDGAVSQKLYTTLTGIQMGLIKDRKGWTVEIN